MKFKFLCFAILPLAAFFCGCSQLTLATGKYETTLPGREDFAAIYDDLIFIRIREPNDDPSQNSYWDWAGNFEIEDDGHILLKMDKPTARKWNFHYDFYRRDGMITVYDLGAENSYNLRHRPGSAAQRRNHQQGDFSTYN